MVNFIIAFVAVVLFCFCCRHLISVVVSPLPSLNQTGYSKAALRVKKQYQVFSWSLMTVAFLMGLVVSFYQVYSQI